MAADVTERFEYPHLSFYIKKDGKAYTVWLNGCRIGKPDGKYVREFKALNIYAARAFIAAEAKRRLWLLIQSTERQLIELRNAWEGLPE
jgi:hypothetical protein